MSPQKTIRVYKYLDARWGLVALCDRRLKISEIGKTNDHWECQPHDMSNPITAHGLQQVIAHFAPTMGLLCFSKVPSSPVMWSHYAAGDEGLCLAFDVPSNDGNGGELLLEVTYQAALFTSPGTGDFSQEDVKRIFLTKNENWSYEEEIRWFPSLRDRINGLAFMEFGPQLSLCEVLLGPKCTLEAKALRRVLGPEFAKVPTHRTKYSKVMYRVIVDHDHTE